MPEPPFAFLKTALACFPPLRHVRTYIACTSKDDNHIFAEWRLQGYLKFPWHPYVKPYTGTTLYTLDPEGFITRHEETWSITALDAARATITPTAGPQAAATPS